MWPFPGVLSSDDSVKKYCPLRVLLFKKSMNVILLPPLGPSSNIEVVCFWRSLAPIPPLWSLLISVLCFEECCNESRFAYCKMLYTQLFDIANNLMHFPSASSSTTSFILSINLKVVFQFCLWPFKTFSNSLRLVRKFANNLQTFLLADITYIVFLNLRFFSLLMFCLLENNVKWQHETFSSIFQKLRTLTVKTRAYT